MIIQSTDFKKFPYFCFSIADAAGEYPAGKLQKAGWKKEYKLHNAQKDE